MLQINEKQVAFYLTEDACRNIMEETLGSVSKGDIHQTLRSAIHLTDINVFGIMPSYIKPKKVFGAKMISVFPENRKHGVPSHQGSIILFESEYGKMRAIVDGEAVTAVRTAAVSAVATKYLSNEDSKVLTILGAGLQGRQHVKAILRVRNIEEVRIWDQNFDFAVNVAKELENEYGIKITAFETAKEAVRTADVICTVTNIREPIIHREWLKEGVHINAVGACTPDAREIDSETMKAAKIYVDFIESTINESGDFLIPMKEGIYDMNHIEAEIGEVINGEKIGRRSSNEITLFESLGLASEDIAAAQYVYERVLEERMMDHEAI